MDEARSEFFFPGQEHDNLQLGSCLPDSDARFGFGRQSCGAKYHQMGRSVRNGNSVLVGFAGCCPQHARIADKHFGHFEGCKSLLDWQVQARTQVSERHNLTRSEQFAKSFNRFKRDPVKRVLFSALAGVLGCWCLLLAFGACFFGKKGDEVEGEIGPIAASPKTKAHMTRVPTEAPPEVLGHVAEVVPRAEPEMFEIGEDEDEDIELKASDFDFGDDGDRLVETSRSGRGANNLDRVALE